MFNAVLYATSETLLMVFLAGGIAVLGGLPLAVILYATGGTLWPKPWLHHTLGVVVNVVRSFPFFIFMIALMPLTRLVVGTSIGTLAASVPLSLAAIPFLARLLESSLADVPKGLIEAANSMGATRLQIVMKILLPEALPGMIRQVIVMLVTLVGYSAMAGAVGGGGLGSMAFNEGYQRFNFSVMLITVLILIVLVQIIQWLGDFLIKRSAI